MAIANPNLPRLVGRLAIGPLTLRVKRGPVCQLATALREPQGVANRREGWKMGMMQRRKGAAGEREAAEKLNEVLGTKFHRGRQYHGGPESPDLAGDLPGLHLEVKRVEALRLYPSLEQARRDAATDEVPAVIHRPNRKPWVVIVYADDLIRLLDVVDACRARIEDGAEKDALCATRTKLSPLILASPPKGQTPSIPQPQAASPLPPRGGGGPDQAGWEQAFLVNDYDGGGE